MSIIRQLFFATVLLFFIQKISAQNITLDSIFTVDITEIKFKKTAGMFLGGVISNKGEKFIIIDLIITSNVKKRVRFPVYKLLLISNENQYMAKPEPDFTPFDDKNRYVKVKKKQKATIYIIVKDSFRMGDFYYGEDLIGKLTVSEENKTGQIILNN